MTICQYFLVGRCRYGQNCRFEHSYQSNDDNRNSSNTEQLSNVIKQIGNEVILAEKGGQWPLSCYSPVKKGPNIPGWEDVSPEEVRWKMYQARANGTLNQCINEIKQLYVNAEKNRNLIKQPTIETVNLLISILEGKKPPVRSNFPVQANSTNIFGNSAQTAAGQRKIFGNVLGSHGTLFGGSAQPSGVQNNIFGASGQSPSTQGSIFGGSASPQGNIFGGVSSNFANQNIFGGSNSTNTLSQNIFSNTSSNAGNIFSSTSDNSQNIFANVQKPAQGNVFGSSTPQVFLNQASNDSLFGSQNFFQNMGNQASPQTNVFGGSQNAFTSQNAFESSSNALKTQTTGNIFESKSQITSSKPNASDSSVYSKVEDLSEEEISFFKAPTFSFGKIPLKPPAQEYCC